VTSSQQLEERLNKALAPHGMKIVDGLDWPTGSHRRMDTCRWNALVGLRDAERQVGIWSVASWSTIRDCLRYGFEIDFNVHLGEADIMVEAKK